MLRQIKKSLSIPVGTERLGGTTLISRTSCFLLSPSYVNAVSHVVLQLHEAPRPVPQSAHRILTPYGSLSEITVSVYYSLHRMFLYVMRICLCKRINSA